MIASIVLVCFSIFLIRRVLDLEAKASSQEEDLRLLTQTGSVRHSEAWARFQLLGNKVKALETHISATPEDRAMRTYADEIAANIEAELLKPVVTDNQEMKVQDISESLHEDAVRDSSKAYHIRNCLDVEAAAEEHTDPLLAAFKLKVDLKKKLKAKKSKPKAKKAKSK